MRSVGVGDSLVGPDDDLKIREKELRTIVIGQMEDKEQRNVGVQVRFPLWASAQISRSICSTMSKGVGQGLCTPF